MGKRSGQRIFAGVEDLAIDSGEQDDRLLSQKEIVRYLDNITLVMLHVWMKAGLPYHKQGGRVYFIKSEVLTYIKSNRLGNAS